MQGDVEVNVTKASEICCVYEFTHEQMDRLETDIHDASIKMMTALESGLAGPQDVITFLLTVHATYDEVLHPERIQAATDNFLDSLMDSIFGKE